MITNLNQKYLDRILAVQEEIADIYLEEKDNNDDVAKYAKVVSLFIGEMFSLENDLCDEYFEDRTFNQLLELNHGYYKDITGDAYNHSFANPDISTKSFGPLVGQILSSVYFAVRCSVGYAFEGRKVSIMWVSEKFIDIYKVIQKNRNNLKDNSETAAMLIEVLKKHSYIDMEEKSLIDLYRRFNPEFNVYSKVINNFTDDRYIFKYGMYVSYNEIELIKYFKTCSDEQLQTMADTYTEAFIRGFERNNVDLSVKKTVNIAYHLGFEPVIKKALKNLSKYNLKPLVYYELAGNPRPRLMNTKPSKQMEYDHKMDDGLIFDENYMKVVLGKREEVLEDSKDMIKAMAGPAVMEVFGETPFEPKSKDTTVKYDDDMKKLQGKYRSDNQQLFSKYLPRSKYSFVIISFPVPEIGKQFKEIFDETIKVNTLDEKKYMDIQQKIIEALDNGVKVHITGRNGNLTDLYVALNDKVNTDNETNFNNCTADVNVPVGEVFTSPKLCGTIGKLHVKEVYLHGLNYKDLEIDFVDGMMDSYTCKNFDEKAKNIEFIQENLTHPHKTLPLGEFAIGTNTTAYVMAKKYDIEKIIPILIGEKMGPHFAVGDTCYTWSEDVAVYNPDGREIVARENSKTSQRNTNIEDAYTYCHTDITIPYSELDRIIVIKENGDTIDIIKEGKFVLSGTELLNEPLKNIEV